LKHQVLAFILLNQSPRL